MIATIAATGAFATIAYSCRCHHCNRWRVVSIIITTIAEHFVSDFRNGMETRL